MSRLLALLPLVLVPLSIVACEPPKERIGFTLQPVSGTAGVRLTFVGDGGVETVRRHPEEPWTGGPAADFQRFEAALSEDGAALDGRLDVSTDAGLLVISAATASSLPEWRKGQSARAIASLGTFRVLLTGTERDEVELIAQCRYTTDAIPEATAAYAEAEVTSVADGRLCIRPEGVDGGISFTARRVPSVLGTDQTPEFQVELGAEASTFGQVFAAQAASSMEVTFEVAPPAGE